MCTNSTTTSKLQTFVTKSDDQSETFDNDACFVLESKESRDEDEGTQSEKWRAERIGNDETRDVAACNGLLLPVASASFDLGQERAKDTNNLFQSPERKNYRRYHTSVLDNVQDDASFHLLDQAFDSLSESYLREMDKGACEQTPIATRTSMWNPISRSCDVDISVPFITSNGNAMCDISPLKDDLEPLPFSEGSPLQWMLNPLPMMPTSTTHQTSSPFFVLGSCRQAFAGCAFQLPYLYDTRLCPINLAQNGSFQHHKSSCNEFDHYQHADLAIAKRRVKSAICAFGGNSVTRPVATNERDFIFRHRNEEYDARSNYEYQLQHRYFMCGNRISWDVEESPPLHAEYVDAKCARSEDDTEYNPSGLETPVRRHVIPEITPQSMSPTLTETEFLTGMELPKMKYRCKLCGQPKMSHVCPYRQSVQRSIGIQVYPTANPFAANEPGALAPTLTDMNNTVINECDESDDGDDALQQCNLDDDYATLSDIKVAAFDNRKRSYDDMNDDGHIALPVGPFADEVEVRPEQYRFISPHHDQSTGAFEYPPVALSFHERKKLSDTLFVMTQSIHQLSMDCASVLRDARERGMWDLAVAELLAQVVVAMHCDEGDKRLDGLQQYLLHLGIAC